MEMAQAKVNNNKYLWYLTWALILVGAVFAGVQAMQEKGPVVRWQRVAMDGHRTGAKPVTVDNLAESLGSFDDEGYLTPSGVRYEEGSSVAQVAQELMEVQPQLSYLKQVVGHSADMYMNLRTQPDLPLGNLVADAIREYGSRYFHVPMDFSLTNFGGIRTPMPKGGVTLDDISSMFPFKNYLCHVRMKGASLQKLLEQLSGTKAFQAVSGCEVKVQGGKLESALVGGKPIDPERVYNVTSIDFLLDGGDKINLGALAESVTLSHVLVKEAILDYVKRTEAEGKLIEAKSDGRVIMED